MAIVKLVNADKVGAGPSSSGGVDALPHQIESVYERMFPPVRLRFLRAALPVAVPGSHHRGRDQREPSARPPGELPCRDRAGHAVGAQDFRSWTGRPVAGAETYRIFDRILLLGWLYAYREGVLGWK